MIKVNCEIKSTVNYKDFIIKMSSYFNDRGKVELEIDGEKYIVSGKDLVTAVNNCLNINNTIF